MTLPQVLHESQNWDGADRRRHRGLPPSQGVKFDPTINLGHILTFVGFFVAGFTAWSTLDKRMTVVEERVQFQAQIDRAQDARLLESLATIREALNDIKSNINRMRDSRRSVL